MRIHLLGGVGATDDAGGPLDVGPAKCQAVLAALALSVGETVPVPRLVDVVWGEDPPRTAEKTLQGHIATLRKALGPDAIVRPGAAYRLAVAPDVVDVTEFRQLLSAGDIDGALAAWGGTPLAGLDVPGLAAAVDGLVEQWLGAVEQRMAQQVADAPTAAIGQLTELTATHPFREELWALLMTALYRAGRQADALAAFQRARDHLVDELGVEPGRHLREVEAQVLEQRDWEGSDDPGAAAPPATEVSPPGGRGHLPRPLSWLVGRDGDLAAIAEAMAMWPVVTLVGPGGIGKTTLALAAARRVESEGARRVWLAELGEIASSADVPTAVAEAIGVTGGAGRSLTESIVAVLRSRPTLLLLDNCEHVIDGAAALARAVAEGGGDALVLATSREGLAIAGEQLVEVPPLDPAGSAVELFTDRARAVSASFDPDASRAAIETICRRVDGLPLAIELIAARSRTMPPRELLDRLDDRLRLVGGSRRTGAERHRTLRATIQWSYDLLTPDQQAVLERLSVFAGPFTIAAAEAVAGDTGATEVDVRLDELVDRSMVSVVDGAGDAAAGRRFRLLDTVRQFAAEHLAVHGAADDTARRHARWYRGRVAAIGELLTGPSEIQGVAQLAELWPDLRAAVEWACTTHDRDLADALVRPIAAEADLRRRAEIGDFAERILALTPPKDEDAAVFWLLWAGHRHAQAGDAASHDALLRRHGHSDHPLVRFNEAYLSGDGGVMHPVALEAVAWLRRHGQDHAADLVEVGGVAASLMTLGRFDDLDALAADMVRRHRSDGPPTLRYFALGMRGYAAQFQGRTDDAARFFTEAAVTELPAGTYRVIQTVVARLAFEDGDRPQAYRLLLDNIDDLLDTDHTDVTRMVAVEFIAMMADDDDHRADAARVLSYLDTVGDFATVARHSLIPDAVARIEADPSLTDEMTPALAPRAALVLMREVLDAAIRSALSR